MKTYRAAVASAVALLTALAGTAGCDSVGGGGASGGGPDIVIGADLELSGAGATLGVAYRRALELKIDQVNRQNLLGGRKVRLEVRDNRSDQNTSASNVASLAADGSVSALIMGACAECVTSVSSTVNQAKLPTISLALSSAVVAPAEQRRYVFKLAPNASDDAPLMAAELKRARATSVALLTTKDGYGTEMRAALETELAKAKIDITDSESLRDDDVALGELAHRVADSKPDAVIVIALAPLPDQVSRALRDARYHGQIFFDAAAADDLFITGPNASAVTGALMVFTPTLVSDDIIATSPAKAARKAWFRDYASRYGTYSAFASFAADAVQLVVDAADRVSPGDREALREALESAQLEGLSGPIRMTAANHSGLMPQALTTLVASGDRWRLAG
ncbi:ABC transporter substrate-binding protein [Rhizomonospora bruguierae]|uniref:ABC transporter substrate-binding protein n=1 Tax=Rhizomonospora bruguierae TaxID=1581705 RepID=UPI0020BEF0FB|nr:ABC transporter substrate-binding protein [Micromonospora sp. NBRC 107566]